MLLHKSLCVTGVISLFLILVCVQYSIDDQYVRKNLLEYHLLRPI